MVGVGGIEPPTSCSQNRRATAAPHPEPAHNQGYRFCEYQVKVNITISLITPILTFTRQGLRGVGIEVGLAESPPS